jgi:hypothetical protein
MVCVTASNHLFAQRESNMNEPSILVKFAPFKLLGPEMKLSLSVERRFSHPFSIQLQADYIFDMWQTQDMSIPTNYINKGFRIIPELRYYYSNTNMGSAYVAGNIMYKQLTRTYEEYRTKTDGSGQPFLQLTPIDLTKKVYAIHFLTGGLFYLDRSKRMAIDFNGGIGLRSRIVTSSIPFIDNGNMFFNSNSNTVTPGMVCNLKICYSFFR